MIIREWIGSYIYRLVLRSELWLIRKLSQLRVLLFSLGSLRFRLLSGCEEKIGANKEFDDVFFIAARKILMPLVFDEKCEEIDSNLYRATIDARHLYQKYKDQIEGLIAKHGDDEVLQRAHQISYSTYIASSKLIKNSKVETYYCSLLEREKLNVLPTSFSDLQKYKRWALHVGRVTADELSERFVFKLSFTLEDALRGSALFYSILLVAAYFRVRLLYGNFGVRVSDYFGVSDYLAASLEILGPAAVASGFAMLMMFLGIQNATGKIYIESGGRRWDWRILVDISIYIGAILIPLSSLLLDSKQIFYSTLQIPFAVLSFHLSAKLARSVFRDGRLYLFILNFVFLFAGYVYCGTMQEVAKIQYEELSTCEQYKFVEPTSLDACDLRLIGNTEKNVFFYQKSTQKTLIAPASIIESVTVKPVSTLDIYQALSMMKAYVVR